MEVETAQAIEILAEELPLHQPHIIPLLRDRLNQLPPDSQRPCMFGWHCYQGIEHNWQACGRICSVFPSPSLAFCGRHSRRNRRSSCRPSGRPHGIFRKPHPVAFERWLPWQRTIPRFCRTRRTNGPRSPLSWPSNFRHSSRKIPVTSPPCRTCFEKQSPCSMHLCAPLLPTGHLRNPSFGPPPTSPTSPTMISVIEQTCYWMPMKDNSGISLRTLSGTLTRRFKCFTLSWTSSRYRTGTIPSRALLAGYHHR